MKPVRVLAVGVVDMIPDEVGAVCFAFYTERIGVEMYNSHGVGVQAPQRNVFLIPRIRDNRHSFCWRKLFTALTTVLKFSYRDMHSVCTTVVTAGQIAP